MKTHFYTKSFLSLVVILFMTTNLLAQPTITGPANGGPEYVSGGTTTGVIYTTEPNMTNYVWDISADGDITAGATTNEITVTWNNPTGEQWISVNYEGSGYPATVLYITYYPFLPAIDPALVPKFVDPLPHFAAGLRIDARKGGNLLVKAALTQQIALSTGTPLLVGTAGDASGNGKGYYAGYAVSKDGGRTFGPVMWPGQTIDARQGYPLKVTYRNDLFGVNYGYFNILADQTLMMNGYDKVLTGEPLLDPYMGPIPMVAHLHGGEIPSASDGGPNAWFMPGYSLLGPAFAFEASSQATYPNQQEAATLWFHPHDDGLTRINVYTGLAAFYFLRGPDEETDKLPGWSQDDLVREVTPDGKTTTFSGNKAYLPEIELAIQDRMFNTKGELYWPVEPTNPDIHPYWTPEFIGNIMTVNGKTWPYLSVAPRKYRFRILDGCNARMLNMWLEKASDKTPGPKITVIGGEGGLLANPVSLDPASNQYLFIAPGQRYDVVIDFSGFPSGTAFTLRNNANAPYPSGDEVISGATDIIMQFIVNGQMVSASNTAKTGTDKSQVPTNLRPVNPLVTLTDFNGGNVQEDVHRQLILNEVTGAGGPATVQVNNTYFEAELTIAGSPYKSGGPTEFQREGTIEKIEIINTTADAHPIHIHLLQWQLVNRRKFDSDAYMTAYADAWANNGSGLPIFPDGLGYPGGAGTPYPYNTKNGDDAIGGNPAVSPFYTDPAVPANPEERGWKDNIVSYPGEVATFMTRIAPTNKPLNSTPDKLLFPFDPSLGPGYVVHCHIIDHEDMSMMRGLIILPSPERFPKITIQPASVTKCIGDGLQFTVKATSATQISYRWQLSTDAGATWSNLAEKSPYSGTLTNTLKIKLASASMNNYQYQCVLNNIDGQTVSNAAVLTVIDCSANQDQQAIVAAEVPVAPDVSVTPSTEIVPAAVITVADLKLDAYPNPAKSSTTVTYVLPADGDVTLAIYSSLGNIVRSLVNQSQQTGTYSVNTSLASLKKGTYYLKLVLNSSNGPLSKTVTLIKN